MTPEILKALREAADRTQEDVAASVGISTSQVNRYEKGKRDPSLTHLRKLAKTFHTTVATIAGEKSPHRVPVIRWSNLYGLDENQQLALNQIEKYVHAMDLPDGNWIALRVEDNMMELIAPIGSYIFIDRNDKVLQAEKYYVFTHPLNEAVFRKLRINPFRLQPFSNNPDAETIACDREPTVIGRVRHVINNLD